MPIDYETEKHRGFAFIEFELPEDAQVIHHFIFYSFPFFGLFIIYILSVVAEYNI
jgi:positive regulator of sigma E activity